MAEMTLQDAFDAHIKGRENEKTLVNNFKSTLRDLESAGFPPDTPVSKLNTEKGIANLQQWATNERFKGVSTGSGMFASRVKTLINAGIGPEQTNVLSNYEKANRGKPTEFGIRLTRKARKLELPAFDDFNQAIDATARQIDDKEAKAFFMIKTLTGLRNPDILQLQVGNAAEGAKYGSFDPEVKKLYNLSNKGDRINYDLGEIVHGILADLAADAQAAGRTQLFTQSEEKIRGIINPVMRANMSSMGLEIRDLTKNASVDFSVRDLRKNIFDILEEEIGAADANKVLGHSQKADVGLNYYKVERKSRRSLSRLQSSQEIFSNLYMESVGFDNPQTLFGSDGYGFANDNFKTSTLVPLTVDAPAEQQTVESQTRTAAAQASGAVDRSVDSLENKIKKLETLITKTQDLTEQTAGLSPADDKAAAKAKKKEAAAGKFDDFLSDMAEEFSSVKTTLKSSAIAAATTGLAFAKQAPGPLFDLIGGLVDKESYDVAEQKGRTFVSELTGQPEDSFLSRMGGGAGVVGEMVTGAVADPEGAARTNLQMLSLMGRTPILDLTGGIPEDAPAPSIPDAVPPQTGTLEAEDAAAAVQDVENRARRGQTTSMLDVQPQTL
jgi:hypothetical protein